MQMTQRLEQAAIALSVYVRDEDGRPRIPSRDELPDEPLSLPELAQLEHAEALDEARRRRPEYVRFDALLERAEIARALARNGRLPRADARVGVSRDLGQGTADATQRLSGTILEAGVTIASPVPNRTARRRTAAREAELDAVEHERRAFEELLHADVARALLDVRATAELVAVEQEAASVAEQLASAERTRFEQGATSMLFVNLREQAAAEARIGVIERIAEALSARATLDAVLGRLRAP
jgi:outer membrane protein TolC